MNKSFENINLDFLKNDNVEVKEVGTDIIYKELKLLVVDDNKDIHKITKLIMKDFNYKDYKLNLVHAYSAEETIEILKEQEIAIILLDVVMETRHAGLDVVKYIREELDNQLIRIILRTGQPGEAPEDKVIKEYNINNYIAKNQGSVQKIYTALYAAIRSYIDLKKISYSKEGLEKVVKASREWYRYDSFISFYDGVLFQLAKIFEFDDDSFLSMRHQDFNGFIGSQDKDKEIILSGIGRFLDYKGKTVEEVLGEDIVEKLKKTKSNEVIFYEDFYIGAWKKVDSNELTYIYFETNRELNQTIKQLIKLVVTNFSLAFNNFRLNYNIKHAQEEMIYALGDIIETRLRDNHNHIYRVSEIACLLAKEYGIDDYMTDLIRVTAPLHDIGKLNIPDRILLKPGKLTEEEFEEIKTHTTKGYELLNQGNYEIFEVASTIAHEHHEKWNGKGYPNQLLGEDISICGRIVSVADVFDALTHDRAYKRAWTIEETVAYFKQEVGVSFDPDLVDILLDNIDKIEEILEQYPD